MHDTPQHQVDARYFSRRSQAPMSPATVTEQNGTEGIAPPGRPTYKIASIPADGIGPEVISAGIQVLETLTKELDTFGLEFGHLDWGSAYYRKNGQYLPDNALDILKGYNAILFGAVGDPGLSSLCPSPG
jgi:isocitrate dehydrogenase